MRSLWPVLGVVLFVGNVACTSAPPTPTSATVSDYSVPVDVSEVDALVPRGFAGQGTLGRFGQGCEVTILKLTDRAAQVNLVRCPPEDTTTSPASLKSRAPIPVWVARSALNVR